MFYKTITTMKRVKYKMDFSQKYVVITGAAGKIGSNIAKQFAKRGANLILLDHPSTQKEIELTGSLSEKYGVDIYSYFLDILNIPEIIECMNKLKKDISRIDVLVNSAGVNSFTSAMQVTEDIWDQVIDVNLKGTFFITQQIASWMIHQKKGAIVNIASQHGIVGNLNRAPYCASKAGVINLSRALASEWAKYQIRVNSVSPTFVHDINDELNNNFLTSSKAKREYISRIPLRRYATPTDIVNAVLYLSSDMAQMVTGHNLVVDGGWTAI